MSNLRIIRDTLVRAPYWQLGRGPERAGRYLVFCCLTVACLIAMLLRASEDGEWTFWVSNFIFLGVFLNYLVLLRERRDVFEPVVLVAAMLALGFACRGIFLHLAFDSARVNPWVSANLDLLGRMSVYTTGGFALFLLAYYLPIGPLLVSRIPRMRTAWNMASLGPKAIRIYLLCLPAKLMTVIPQGAFPLQDQLMRYLGNVIGLVASLADVALILYGIYYYHRRCEGRRGRMPFYAILTVQLAVGILTGYREPLLISLMALLFVKHYVHRRLKLASALATFLILMFVATPVSRAYRHLTRVEHQAPLTAARNIPRQVAYHGQNRPTTGAPTLSGHLTDALFGISHRFHGADSLIACMATVPEYLAYQNGRTLYLLPLSVFVPRALWPDKPKIGLGSFFRDNIWKGPTDHSTSGGQIAMSQTGELYINFGTMGIVFGMFILGIIHRLVYCYFIEGHERGNFSALLFYFAAVICFLGIERNFAFAYGYLLKLFLFIYFLCRYLNRGPVFSRA